jgi:hypothetical protein
MADRKAREHAIHEAAKMVRSGCPWLQRWLTRTRSGMNDAQRGKTLRTRVGVADIARNVTHDVCSHCGEIAGMGAHGHSDAPDWRWLRVEYVPVEARDKLDALEGEATREERQQNG